MSQATEYLAFVEKKLADALLELGEDLEESRDALHKMNEYYWENYTEMDEYGYENYDNQQALLRTADAHHEKKLTRQRLERMVDAPFFGSVAFRFEDDEEYEDEDETPEMFYIGIGNFSARKGDIPLIYDWRAPVSSLFYDYDCGPASYEAPMGEIQGEVTSKYQYKIRKGRMVYEFENDTKIDDEILKQELGKHGDVKLKNIIRTIQKEQNAIIRNTKDKVLLIQGAAGSGKTSIALHRIAYLLYRDRNHLKSSQVLILSPNSVFADYISHILPELGEENIQEMSLDIFAYRELRDTAGDCEDRYHHMERLMKLQKKGLEKEYQKNYRYLQSKEFVSDMEGFLLELEDRLLDIHDVTYKMKSPADPSGRTLFTMTMTAEDIRTLIYDKYADCPILSRMDMVAERFMDEFETLYFVADPEQELPPDQKEVIYEKFREMYVSRDYYQIFNWFLEDLDLPVMEEHRREKRVLRYEHVYPILYMKYRLQNVSAHRLVRHLVVDEMQDYTYLQYRILQMLFPCSKTVLGDRAQTLEEEEGDVLDFLPEILGRDSRIIRMNRSYRNTLEIAGYADRICKVEGIEYFERHGKPVEEIHVQSRTAAWKKILEQVNVGEDGYETAAILAMNEREAVAAYEYMKQYTSDIHYLDRDSSSFRKGITVTTWYLAKGLEFDQVFLLPSNRESSLYSQFHYIGATRALHELYVYEI